MGDISKNEGRTILFVSHNMLAVKTLCSRGILVSKGEISQTGPIDKLIENYSVESELRSQVSLSFQSESLVLKQIWIKDNGINGCFNIIEDLNLYVEIEFKKEFTFLNVNIFFNTPDGGMIFATCSEPKPYTLGTFIFNCQIPANILNDNIYSLDIMVVSNQKILHTEKEVINIEGVESKREGSWLGKFPGLIRPMIFNWHIIKK
jgi:lipopolysaccharide transport system ATP-binding protein